MGNISHSKPVHYRWIGGKVVANKMQFTVYTFYCFGNSAFKQIYCPVLKILQNGELNARTNSIKKTFML